MSDDDREATTSSFRHEELLREGDEHPSAEDIASLLDGGEAVDEARLRDHLSKCRRCFGVYAELAETELGWRRGHRGAEIPADLLQAAMAVGRPAAAKPTPPTLRRAWKRTAWYATAAVVVVVGLGALLVSRMASRAPAIDPTIRDAVALASRTGMVLTADIAPAGSNLRGDDFVDRRRLAARLNELGLRYDRPNATEETAYWLVAGMLAEGDPGVRPILDDALRRFPGSFRLENLAAVLAYRDGRVEEAERRLRGVLDERPEDVVALFNLAVLLKEQRRESELREVYARLQAETAPGILLQTRADSEFGAPTQR